MIADSLILVLRVLEIAILIRVLYSWVDPNPYPTNELKRLLWAVTDPVLQPLRRFVPPIGMLDITPIVALVLLQVVERLVSSVLRGY
jgi:YggT family protein